MRLNDADAKCEIIELDRSNEMGLVKVASRLFVDLEQFMCEQDTTSTGNSVWLDAIYCAVLQREPPCLGYRPLIS